MLMDEQHPPLNVDFGEAMSVKKYYTHSESFGSPLRLRTESLIKLLIIKPNSPLFLGAQRIQTENTLYKEKGYSL